MSASIKRRSATLYSHLNTKQQRSVLLQLIAERNGSEIQTLLQAIPRKTYRMPDADVVGVVDDIMIELLGIACEFWRTAFAIRCAIDPSDEIRLHEKLDGVCDEARAAAKEFGIAPETLAELVGLPVELIDESVNWGEL